MTDAESDATTDVPTENNRLPLRFIRASELPRGATDEEVREAIQQIDGGRGR